jgi:hypothetical protein
LISFIVGAHIFHRLLLIFNLAKYTLQEAESDHDQDDTKVGDIQKLTRKPKSFWSNPKLVSDKYMLCLLAMVCGAALIVPIVTTLSSLIWDNEGELVLS